MKLMNQAEPRWRAEASLVVTIELRLSSLEPASNSWIQLPMAILSIDVNCCSSKELAFRARVNNPLTSYCIQQGTRAVASQPVSNRPPLLLQDQSVHAGPEPPSNHWHAPRTRLPSAEVQRRLHVQSVPTLFRASVETRSLRSFAGEHVDNPSSIAPLSLGKPCVGGANRLRMLFRT